jgi:hypothetical protein
LTINQLSLSENALKLASGNAEFQNFPGRTPDSPLQGEGKEEREESRRVGRGGEGRGGVGEVGREEVEGKG